MSIEVTDLREAMAPHLGATLTPERAAAIEAAARIGADRTIDADAFEPHACGRYLLWVERLRDMADELAPLMLRQFAETEAHRAALGQDVAGGIAKGLDMERRGAVVHLAARCATTGQMAGYMRLLLSESLHTGTLAAIEDGLYVAPEHRRGTGLGLALVRHAQRVAAGLGARQFIAEAKDFNRVGLLYERLGFARVSSRFSKLLEAQHGR